MEFQQAGCRVCVTQGLTCPAGQGGRCCSCICTNRMHGIILEGSRATSILFQPFPDEEANLDPGRASEIKERITSLGCVLNGDWRLWGRFSRLGGRRSGRYRGGGVNDDMIEAVKTTPALSWKTVEDGEMRNGTCVLLQQPTMTR